MLASFQPNDDCHSQYKREAVLILLKITTLSSSDDLLDQNSRSQDDIWRGPFCHLPPKFQTFDHI